MTPKTVAYIQVYGNDIVYMEKEFHEADLTGGVRNSVSEAFEKFGFDIFVVDMIKVFVDSTGFLRVAYIIGNQEFAFITNTDVFIQLKPTTLTED